VAWLNRCITLGLSVGIDQYNETPFCVSVNYVNYITFDVLIATGMVKISIVWIRVLEGNDQFGEYIIDAFRGGLSDISVR
jgi:hypothetical protein